MTWSGDTDLDIGRAAMLRLIRKSGAERVSDDAADELRKVLVDIGSKIASNAVGMSEHAGRKTVKAPDIAFATRTVLKQG